MFLPQYILREFKMTNARSGESRTIRQFQFIEWPEQGVPKSGEGFIDFIGQVEEVVTVWEFCFVFRSIYHSYVANYSLKVLNVYETS